MLGVGPSSRAQEQAEHPEHESCSCFRCCLSRVQSTVDPSSGSVPVDGDYRCDFQARRSEPASEDIQSSWRNAEQECPAAAPAVQPFNPRVHKYMLEKLPKAPPVPASRMMQLGHLPYPLPTIEERIRMQAYPPSQSQPDFVHQPLNLTQMVEELNRPPGPMSQPVFEAEPRVPEQQQKRHRTGL